ncbi:MAG: regulatory protein [Gaiellaceae bacterium]|nr:regulatory protein [Gaiellaceae bacterium]
MPTVTRLRDDRRGRVAVDLDGTPWRTLPIDVVARTGLVEGRELDRRALRLLRQELRRAEALAIAARALRRQDLSERSVADRLAAAAVPPAVLEESLGVLSRAGLVDDARFAARRAASLAERGYGNTAIRHDLEGKGIDPHLIHEALDTLEAEADRAQRLVDRRGAGAKTARYLASKGFGEEALEAAAGADFAPEP